MLVTFTYMIEVETGYKHLGARHWLQAFDDKESALKWLSNKGYEQINKNSFKKHDEGKMFYVGTLIE